MSEVKVLDQSNQEVGLSFDHYFEPFRIQANEWMEKAKQIKITDASQTDLMKEARTARLALRSVRIGVDNLHEEKKAHILKEGQTLDKIKRELNALIKPIEEELKAQEDFVEIQEENRKQTLRRERVSLLSPFIGFQQAELMQLGDMDEQVFNTVLEGQKVIKEQREKQVIEDARIKAETEQNRRVEDERIREENKLLKRYNGRVQLLTSIGFVWIEKSTSYHHEGIQWGIFKEKIEKLSDGEFEHIFNTTNDKVFSYNKTQKEKEKADRDKAEKERLKQQEKLNKERDERKKLEKDAADKLAQEEAKKKQQLSDERKLKRAPDRAKLLSFAGQIDALQALEMTSEEGQEILKSTKTLLDKTVVYLKSKAEAL